jgi:ATP-binding cassette, subfamily B, bacterial
MSLDRQAEGPVALLARLARPYAGAIVAMVGLSAVSVALAMVGPRLVGVAIDEGIPPARAGDCLPLARTGALLAAAAVLAGLVTALGRRRVGQVGQAMVYDLRQQVNTAFQRLPIAYHERWSSGLVISRLTADVDTVADLLGTALNQALASLLTCLGLVVAMLLLDLPLAGVVVACVVPGALLAVWFARRITPVRRAQRDAIAETTATVVETLGGIRAVQSYRAEHVHARLFGAGAEALRRIQLRVSTLNAVFWPALELSLGLAAVAVVVVGGYRVVSGSMPIGTLAAFVLYVGMFFAPLATAPYILDAVQTAAAAMRKVTELLAGDDSVPEPTHPVPLPAPIRARSPSTASISPTGPARGRRSRGCRWCCAPARWSRCWALPGPGSRPSPS